MRIPHCTAAPLAAVPHDKLRSTPAQNSNSPLFSGANRITKIVTSIGALALISELVIRHRVPRIFAQRETNLEKICLNHGHTVQVRTSAF